MEDVQPINNKLSKGSNPPIISDCNSSTTFSVKCPSRDLLLGNVVINVTETPKKRFLKKIIFSLVRENYNQKKKIKALNQQVRRQKKQISSLKSMYKMVTTKYVNTVLKISILSITFFIVLGFVKVLKKNNLIYRDQTDFIDQNKA